jgi:alpha-D-ribose 1-methylphosphonate 5-triphosphate synthase subunit PhnG
MLRPSRRERTRVLILGSPDLALGWAAEIRAQHRVEILQAPRAGLVMAQVRESARRSVFNLGEVLVTEAKVRVDGFPGLGLVRGWDESLAESLAIIDAGCRAQISLTQAWEEKLVEASKILDERLSEERRRLETTRVDFQTMDTGV